MRRAIAGALIRLAHKVYPPEVTEMPSDYVPASAGLERFTAGLAGARPALNADRAAEIGVELANCTIKKMSDYARDYASDAVLVAASALAAGPDPRPPCGMPRPGGRFGQVCTRPTGHDGRHGWAGIFWDDPGVPIDTVACVAAEERIAKAHRDYGRAVASTPDQIRHLTAGN